MSCNMDEVNYANHFLKYDVFTNEKNTGRFESCEAVTNTEGRNINVI
jgi:hypothetical protein